MKIKHNYRNTYCKKITTKISFSKFVVTAKVWTLQIIVKKHETTKIANIIRHTSLKKTTTVGTKINVIRITIAIYKKSLNLYTSDKEKINF